MKHYRVTLKNDAPAFFQDVFAHSYYINEGHLIFKAHTEKEPYGGVVASYNAPEWISVIVVEYTHG